jgi:TRAP-type uncharacterized transport system fused permease subunit
MWQTLRYALPAYLVPVAFVAAPGGTALIGTGSVGEVVYALLAAAAAVAAFAVAAGGWILGLGRADVPARVGAAAAGACLLWISPLSTAIGAALMAATVAWVAVAQRQRQRRQAG